MNIDYNTLTPHQQDMIQRTIDLNYEAAAKAVASSAPEAHVDAPEMPMLPLERAFADFVNGRCMENESNTPDFILGQALADVFVAIQTAIKSRDRWYDVRPEPGHRVCREYDWENGKRVTINVGAIFKIGKRLWRLKELPKKLQGDDLWILECADDSGGISCDRCHNFTRSEMQWLYSHGAFVGQPVEAGGALL